MATRTKEPGAPTSFFASLPGVLTAIAAVITAVGGVYGVWWTSRPEPGPGPTPVVHEESSPATDGDLSTEQLEVLVAALLAADGEAEVDADTPADADATSFGEAALLEWYEVASDGSRLSLELCVAGDTASCDEVGYLLVEDCSSYLGPACDALYWLSPVDSPEEELGGTCGGLEPDLAAAGACP